MQKSKVIVVFSSHFNNEKNDEFIEHIHSTIGVKHKIAYYPNFNQYSLSEVYNKAIDEHNEENAIMVFCHHDIIFQTQNWGKLLLNHFNHTDFGIIGVAGSNYLADSGIWWEDRSKMSGKINHTDGVNTWLSEYSDNINGVKPVAVIDGVFMAIDYSKTAHKFNEKFGKYHFYDISYSIDNYLDDVKIGVITNIRILHKSVGQTNDSWEENRVKFVKEYEDVLPIRLFSEDKLKVLICCQFFKNYTGSEMSNYELSKELVKLGCDVTVISSMVGNPLYDKAKSNGVKVYSYDNLPNYFLDNENKFSFIKNQAEFDIIHINHKPIGELMLKLYPNTPAVMHIRSEVIPVFEEPIIDSTIKQYISIRETVTEYIKSYNISDDKIVLIDNPFDTQRFNTNYEKEINPKEIVLFIGTIDYLRINIIRDLVQTTLENNQELWLIGSNENDLLRKVVETMPAKYLTMDTNVKYLGVKPNPEDYLKKCDYTAGIFKGRTTIEGFLCGKPGWIYTVDKIGNILNKVLEQVPNDIAKYDSVYSAKKMLELYEKVISEI